MNRPVPQSLRGIPAGFGGQQQPQQPARAVSNRLPNGKLANNGAGWAFGGAVPMGSAAGLQNANRQMGGNVSFAQSLSGSTPATPLDLSEFPSLSGNAQVPSANQGSMWSNPPSRNIGVPIQRNQPTPMSSQQNQQDELFAPPSRMASAQSPFRFGSQGNTANQTAQPQGGTADEFPPLNRNANGEIGGERGASLMSSLGFGSQGGAGASSAQTSRVGNGLLNALSANSRAAETRSPIGTRPSQDARSSIEDDARLKDTLASQVPASDGASQQVEGGGALGAAGNDAVTGKVNDDKEGNAPQPQDPLAGMAPIDKFGLKGLRTLMNNYPDYNALVCGIDPASLGLDLASSEPLSTQIYSLFDDVPSRPSIPKFRLPECYNVTNVQPIEHKIPNFNEETLMWIFYSSPGDIKQHWAAAELHNRNWRWHKKLQIWLTKDDMLLPQVLSPNHERGYYIIWDTVNWRKERREFTLQYADLEAAPAPAVP